MDAGDRRDQPFRFFRLGVIERHRQFGKFRMGFERRLENEFQFAAFQFFAPSRFGRLPRITDARDLTAVKRQTHIGSALVAGDELDRQAQGHFEHVGKIIRTGARCDAAEFDDLLGSHP